MVSASFLILRILTLASFMISLFLFNNFKVRVPSLGLQYVIFTGASCFYAVMKPYKMNFRNGVDFIILTLLSMMSIFLYIELFHVSMPAFKYGVLAVVTCSTPGTNILHLLFIGKEGKHHPMHEKEIQKVEKMYAGYQIYSSS